MLRIDAGSAGLSSEMTFARRAPAFSIAAEVVSMSSSMRSRASGPAERAGIDETISAYVTVAALPPHIAAARTDGLSALVLDLGISAHGADQRPWLLAGAKTLSYAVNMAALRYAAGRGADDVIFVSTEGQVLEGPRSTVIIAVDGDDGRPCLLTPPPWYPILRGTTQRALFEAARNAGYDCDYRALTATDLLDARGVWLVSSVTLAARVHTLDGRALSPAPLAGAVEALVDTAVWV